MNNLNVVKKLSHVFTLFFLCFIIFNILSFFVLEMKKGDNPIISKYGLETLVTAYPGYDTDTVKDILHENWNSQVVYSTYVQFQEPPKSGKHVNVTSDGFRLNKPSEKHPLPLDKDFLNIFVFGGSTTFGYGLRDHETIPAQLEELMREKNPTIRVYNFGRAFYFSTQERILFEKLLVEGNVPDVAIFIDGLNEFYHPKGDATYTGFLNGAMDNSFYAAQKKFFRELPVVNFARLCRDALTQKSEPGSNPKLPDIQPQESIVLQIINRYVSNASMIKAIAEKNEISSFFFWQPVPEYEMHLASHPFYIREDLQTEVNRVKGYVIGQKMLQNAIPGLVWAAEILDTCKGNFVDKVHYSAKFNGEIAQFIHDNLTI